MPPTAWCVGPRELSAAPTTLYGYARVSTEEQSLQRQLDALQNCGAGQ